MAFQLSLTVTFLALVYLISEYFNENRLDVYLSFQANDGPGYIQPSCFPKPIGVHYFGDFVSTACHSQLPSPYLSHWSSNYFPFAYVLMKPFGFIMKFNFKFSVFLFLLFTTILIIIPIWVSISGIKESATKVLAIVVMVFMTYPFFSVIDRGNIQGLVVGLLMIGVLAYEKNLKTTSAIMFAIAAALKGYPIIFLLIFVRKREWKHLTTSISFLLCSSLISLATFSGGAYKNLVGLLRKILELSETGTSITAYSNSIRALFETTVFFNIPLVGHYSSVLMSHYQIFSITFSLACVVLALQKRITDFEFLIISAIFCALLFDPTPGYVLLVFFVPLVFGLSTYDSLTSQKSKIYLLLMSLLMVPKGIPIKVGAQWPRCDYCPTFNSVLNPLIELVLLTLILLSMLRRNKINLESIPQQVDQG